MYYLGHVRQFKLYTMSSRAARSVVYYFSFVFELYNNCSFYTWWMNCGQYINKVPTKILYLYHTKQYIYRTKASQKGVFVLFIYDLFILCRRSLQSNGILHACLHGRNAFGQADTLCHRSACRSIYWISPWVSYSARKHSKLPTRRSSGSCRITLLWHRIVS